MNFRESAQCLLSPSISVNLVPSQLSSSSYPWNKCYYHHRINRFIVFTRRVLKCDFWVSNGSKCWVSVLFLQCLLYQRQQNRVNGLQAELAILSFVVTGPLNIVQECCYIIIDYSVAFILCCFRVPFPEVTPKAQLWCSCQPFCQSVVSGWLSLHLKARSLKTIRK